VIKSREDVWYRINPLQARTSRVLVALLTTLILFLLGGFTMALKVNSQTMFPETGFGSVPLDVSKTMRSFQMTKNAVIRQDCAGDSKDNVQSQQGGNSLSLEEERWETFFLVHWFTNEGFAKPPDSPKGNMLQPMESQRPSDEIRPDRDSFLLNEEQAFSNASIKGSSDPSHNWKGIGKDTAYFMGYQAIFAGFLYLLPERITNWTSDKTWAQNVQNPTWDDDPFWINYLAHPYFGATYYIRARERGFGDLGSFLYSASLSALFEFGIEAFFEPPSYQDLIATPVGGILIGKFIFEPIREGIKAKKELIWSDHLILILTDPLGAANIVVDRWLGVKSDIRLTGPPSMPVLPYQSPYDAAASPRRQDDNRSRRHDGAGIQLHLVW